MEKSIETIWQEGIVVESPMTIPKIQNLYNRKSILMLDKLVRKMNREVWALIPLSILLFVASIAMGNEMIPSSIQSLIFLGWFILGKYQIGILKKVPYEANCYEHLKSIRAKLQAISFFNLKLGLFSIPVILIPSLIFTYFNQIDKSFGEIVGNAELGGSNLLIFLFLPLIFGPAYIVYRVLSRRIKKKSTPLLDELIEEMEELREA